MSKSRYRILKIESCYLVQKKYWLSGWKTFDYAYSFEEAKRFLVKANPYYIPEKDEIVLEVK